MDLQIVLVILLALIVVNLLAVGIYIIFLIKDLRDTVKRAKIILEEVHEMSNVVASPVTTLAGVVNAVVEGVKNARSITTLSTLRGLNNEEKEKVE